MILLVLTVVVSISVFASMPAGHNLLAATLSVGLLAGCWRQ
jgi:hypothetical protein